MKVEIFGLFGMGRSSGIVSDVHIGDGLYLQKIKIHQKTELYEKIKESAIDDYRAIKFREGRERWPYTHSFYMTLDRATSPDCKEVKLARQLIMRAIVLSRIIKPMPIPLHPTTILVYHSGTGEVEYSVEINIGFYGTAYLSREQLRSSFTQADAELMAKHWVASQHFYDNRKHYKRMHRALMTFNDAYHVFPTHLSHVIRHAALESLICTSPLNNKRQVTKRLPQLLSEVTEAQAKEIYDFCCDVKHTAAPGLLHSADIENTDPRDIGRVRAVKWLEDSLRRLFIRALEDRTFAEDLENKDVLNQKYPIP